MIGKFRKMKEEYEKELRNWLIEIKGLDINLESEKNR
jgi:hypothetical protein